MTAAFHLLRARAIYSSIASSRSFIHASRSSYQDRMFLFAILRAFGDTWEAYSVLLLHQEVDGHLAGLSRSLSREEHLVLFSVSACT